MKTILLAALLIGGFTINSSAQELQKKSNSDGLLGPSFLRGSKKLLWISLDSKPAEVEIPLPPRFKYRKISRVTFSRPNSGFSIAGDNPVIVRKDSVFLKPVFQAKERGEIHDTLNVYFSNEKKPVRFALHGASVLPGQERVSSGSPSSLSNSMEPAAGYKLYPNPVSRVLYLEQPALQKAGGEMQMNVTDLAGRVLYQGPFQSSLVVEDWPKGAYILSIRSEGTVQRMKFLKE